MKKLFSFFSALAVVLVLGGCSNNKKDPMPDLSSEPEYIIARHAYLVNTNADYNCPDYNCSTPVFLVTSSTYRLSPLPGFAPLANVWGGAGAGPSPWWDIAVSAPGVNSARLQMAASGRNYIWLRMLVVAEKAQATKIYNYIMAFRRVTANGSPNATANPNLLPANALFNQVIVTDAGTVNGVEMQRIEVRRLP